MILTQISSLLFVFAGFCGLRYHVVWLRLWNERPMSRPDLIVVLITLLCAPLFLLGLGNTRLVARRGADGTARSIGPEARRAHGWPRRRQSVCGNGDRCRCRRNLIFRSRGCSVCDCRELFSIRRIQLGSANAICGGWLACVPLVAWTMRQAGTGHSCARLAAFLAAVNVPFIVSARQARYYALTSAIVLLVTGHVCRTFATDGAAVYRVRRRGQPARTSFDVTAIGGSAASRCTRRSSVAARTSDRTVDSGWHGVLHSSFSSSGSR